MNNTRMTLDKLPTLLHYVKNGNDYNCQVKVGNEVQDWCNLKSHELKRLVLVRALLCDNQGVAALAVWNLTEDFEKQTLLYQKSEFKLPGKDDPACLFKPGQS